jgi:hypothetical protein
MTSQRGFLGIQELAVLRNPKTNSETEIFGGKFYSPKQIDCDCDCGHQSTIAFGVLKIPKQDARSCSHSRDLVLSKAAQP